MALIIFDIDGTLLETERVTVPAVQRTFAAHGLPIPEEAVICSFFGKPVEVYEAWLAELCPTEEAARIVAETNALELDLIGSEGRLYDGARETLELLQTAGHTLAICSNGPDDYVNTFLDAHEVRSFFSIIRARGTRYSGKEAMAGEILAKFPQRPAFFVGDRDDDVRAAHHHGIFAIAADYGFGGGHELTAADDHIQSLGELPDRLAIRR